jgi:hypothetical protein
MVRTALPELPFTKRKLWEDYVNYNQDGLIGPLDITIAPRNCEGFKRIFFIVQWLEEVSTNPCLFITEFSDDNVIWKHGRCIYMSTTYPPPPGNPSVENEFYSASYPISGSLVRHRITWNAVGGAALYFRSVLSP